MKKLNRKNIMVTVIALLMIFGVNSFIAPRSFSASEEGIKEAAGFDVNTSMMENLAALKGKSVTLTLSSGQTITGIVSDVKGNLLHLAKLSQKEFYDALVAIDHITAIETKVR
ncbi:MAG: hypothetical protein ABSG35_04895 [Syntrophobacteraceae bacterium]|jgi:hypothetical protein